MRLPWLAAFILTLVHFSAIKGARVDDDTMQTKDMTNASVETGGQDDVARTSDPDNPVGNLVTNGLMHALTHALHTRSETKFQIPHAWALQYVNPKWKFNTDYWKSHEYDWPSIHDLETWRTAVKSDLATDMSKWNDKIWLLNWFRANGLDGPEVVWSRYSSSKWHSQQPLRWADPNFGSPAPVETQQAYITKKFTGIDWPGIRRLNSNSALLIQALKGNPSDLMRHLQRFCDNGINDNMNSKGDFVIKASHLSESQGVFIVKDGKLVKDVRFDFIENIEFPVKDFETSDGLEYSKDADTMLNEISQMENKQNVKMLPIFKAFPQVAQLLRKFGKGATVCGGAETLAEVHLIMEFQEMIWVTWESARSKVIPRGTLIEKIRVYDLEIKVTTGLGFAWGYYYNTIVTSNDRLTDNAKKLAYQLAEATAIKAGVDFCRADIVVGERGLIVSELTLVPGLNYFTQMPVEGHISKLIAWHKYNFQRAKEAAAMATVRHDW